MKEFSTIPYDLQGLMGLMLFLLQWGLVFIFFFGIYIKQYEKCKWVYGFFILGIINVYILSQCIAECVAGKETNQILFSALEEFQKIPYMIIIVVILVYFLVELLLLNNTLQWRRHHITGISLKQALDDLPIGLCCYDDMGSIRLKNNYAEQICFQIAGSSFVNGCDIYRKIQNNQLESGCRCEPLSGKYLLFLEEEKVLSVYEEEIENREGKLHLLSFVDISDEYQKTRELKKYQEELLAVNARLVDYNKQFVSVITETEVLRAKVKIHDELGVNLIAAKKYILEQGTKEDRDKIIASLKQNLKFLQNESQIVEKDKFLQLVETANALGVDIELEGNIPFNKTWKDITINGIHECLTNAIRHAQADKLYVKIEQNQKQLRVQITNSGNPPITEIKEGGGLASLRKIIEQNKGTMSISIENGFCLKFILSD